jgi:hypothetical protein
VAFEQADALGGGLDSGDASSVLLGSYVAECVLFVGLAHRVVVSRVPPARYRVVDAVRDLDEDWWHTGGADLHASDRVAIWKYKSSDDRRGIIAFGEVLTDPEMRDLSDDDHTYWIDPAGTAAAQRVRVRCVIKPSAPIWLELAPAGSVIHQLPALAHALGAARHSP